MRNFLNKSGPCRMMQVTWSLVAGGAEIYALTIASRLDKCKFVPFMCAMDQGGALEPEIARQSLPFFIMHRRPGIDWRLMLRLHRLFRRQRVDVLQTHHFNQLFYSVLGAKLVGARIFHTEHDTELAKKPRLRIALRILSLFCEKMIAIGDDIAVMFREIGIPDSKIEIVLAGVELSMVEVSRDEVRRELELADDERVAIIVARLFPEKNHKLLLAAFDGAARQNANARLLIVGEGVEGEAIRAEIARLGLEKQVRMLGVRRDVPRLLAAADVFVLTSDREGLPIAVLEAMAAGKPVIATAVGNLPDVVRDGENGRLVPPGDREALEVALIELLGDASRASQMGAAARETARGYDVRTTIERYEQLFGENSKQSKAKNGR